MERFKNIKIIATDVDGTFVDDKKQVSEFTIEAIKKLKAKNIMFGLCSGRDPKSLKELCKHWKILEYVDFIIGYSGGEIFDLKLKKDAKTHLIKGSALKAIYSHFKDMELNFGIPHDGVLCFPKEDKFSLKLSKYDVMDPQYVDYEQFLNKDHSKLMLVTDESLMPQVIERAKMFDVKKHNVLGLQTGAFLYEFMDEKVSKFNALKILLSWHNLDPSELMVFGDAENDYDMILNAGIGVVMKNGYDIVKKVADFETSYTNKEDGLARFLVDQKII